MPWVIPSGSPPTVICWSTPLFRTLANSAPVRGYRARRVSCFRRRPLQRACSHPRSPPRDSNWDRWDRWARSTTRYPPRYDAIPSTRLARRPERLPTTSWSRSRPTHRPASGKCRCSPPLARPEYSPRHRIFRPFAVRIGDFRCFGEAQQSAGPGKYAASTAKRRIQVWRIMVVLTFSIGCNRFHASVSAVQYSHRRLYLSTTT